MWKFEPILKSTIWGGDKIARFKGIISEKCDIGESWEISGVENSESIVAEGPDKGLKLSELVEKYDGELMGEKNFIKFHGRFPLLIKFIDARDNLSVQVHPDDYTARRHKENNGKSEMWYVLNSEKKAKIAAGFHDPVKPEEYSHLVESGKIEEALKFIEIKKGEVYYIPAGRVHAIGKGAFVLEIQQTSDATYRIYDYNREDHEGNKRELHTDLAAECIDFTDTDVKAIDYKPHPDIPVNVLTTPYFTTNLLQIEDPLLRDYREWDTFVVIIATEGKATITCGDTTLEIRQGETILIPAMAKGVTIQPHGKFSAVETYIK